MRLLAKTELKKIIDEILEHADPECLESFGYVLRADVTDELLIPPKEFRACLTVERFKLNHQFGMISCRSTLSLTGLIMPASFIIHPGFNGRLTLEFYNSSNLPIRIQKNAPVVNLLLFDVAEVIQS